MPRRRRSAIMLFTIIKKEILLNLVSFRFMVTTALLAVLVIGSMQMMAVNYSRRLEDYSTSVEMHKDDLKKLSTRPEFEAFGVTKDPRPAMLGIFVIGVEKQMNRSFMVPGMAMQTEEERGGPMMYSASKLMGIQPEGSKYSNPIFTLFMAPDFVYVVSIVLSLLALLFSFDTISGEKEDQTLKLMLTNAVPRDIVLVGKWIGGTLSIIIPFIASFVVGVLLVWMRPDVSFTEDATARVALIMGVAILYICVFFLIGMVFSTFTAQASTSLILSLFAWVLFVLVIPNIAPVIARQAVPLKTPDQILRDVERIEEQMQRDARKKDGQERREAFERIKKEIPQKVRSLEDRWMRSLEKQIRLASTISRFSPSANYIFASASLAGTGVDDYHKLRDEVLRYRQLVSDKRKDFLKSDKSKPIPMLYIKVDTEEVPEFRDARLDLEESVSKVIWDIGLLVAYMIILFLIAFVRFLTYDVK